MASTCNCIKQIEEKILSVKKKDGVKATAVSIVDCGFLFGINESITISHYEIIVEGRKRKDTGNIMHSYCPFCGKKYKTQG